MKLNQLCNIFCKFANSFDEKLEADYLSWFKLAAKNNDWYNAGKIMGKLDTLVYNERINGAESIRTIKYFKDPELASITIPLDSWEKYTVGYGEGAGLSEEEKEKDLQFTKNILNNFFEKGFLPKKITN